MRRWPALALALAAAGSVGSAQEERGGLTATARVTETLRVEDNRDFLPDPDGVSAVARTEIGFGLASETRRQRFALDLGGTFDAGYFGPDAGTDADVEAASAALSYARQSRDTSLGLDARWSVADVRATETTSVQDISDLVSAEGERQAADVSLALETGRTARFGTESRASYRRRIFTGTDDPDLFDTEEAAAEAGLVLRPSERLALRLTGAASVLEAENAEATRRLRLEAGVGAEAAVTPRLTVTGSVGLTRVETRETVFGIRATDTEDGVSGSLAIARAHPDGATRLSFSSRVEATGTRLTAELGRSIAFRASELSVSVGVTSSEESDPRPFGTLSYARPFRDGELAIDVSQQVTTTVEDDEVLTTRAGVSVARRLDRVTTLELAAAVTDLTLLAGDDTEERRDVSVSATFGRQLTRDWQAVAGYEYRLDTRDDVADRQSNALFLGLTRSFSVRP